MSAAVPPGAGPGGSPGLRHVFVRDMVLLAPIGVHAHEHVAPQRVRINVDMLVADEGDGSDRLGRVVDYGRAVESVRAIVAAGHVKLVETLAERIAGAVLEGDARVLEARVRVEKLDIFADVAAVGVEVARRRNVRGA